MLEAEKKVLLQMNHKFLQFLLPLVANFVLRISSKTHVRYQQTSFYAEHASIVLWDVLPCLKSGVCVCLFIFFTAQSNVTDSVLEVVACEARRLFRDQLVSLKDIHTFDNILSSIIRGDWGSDALDNMTGSTQFYSH